MPKTMPKKDPNDVLDYTVLWATWLGADTIVTSVWVVPTGITKVAESLSTTAATIWLSGGAVGAKYRITNRITTTAGRTKEDSITVTGKDN